MKTKLFALAAIAGILFSSCTKNNEDEEILPVEGTITGTITESKTFAYGNYTLSGIVKVNPGVTVTFEAGSTITCDKATGDNAFVVLNGGKVYMNGTADMPIVFTEKSKVPGAWAGIIIYGDAPAKVAGGGTTSTSEDGNNISYGGSNATHNAGALNYVRVEYAGSKLGDGQKENNAFTFYSVGSATKLDHLVAYKGADDGFEFFGGTVSMTNAISYGNYDDAFDWQDGWQGDKNENWFAYQENKGNFGMEIEASQNNNTFYPMVKNITLKRNASCVPETGNNEVDAFQFKREGNGHFDNVIIDGYGNYTNGANTYKGSAVRIQDALTNTNQVNASKIKLTNVKISNTTNLNPIGATDAIVVSFPTNFFTTSNTATGASLSAGSWATVDGSNLLQNK